MRALIGNIVVIMVLAFLYSTASGQDSDIGKIPDSTTIRSVIENAPDSTVIHFDKGTILDTLNHKRRTPTGALLRSAAFPGWGQFYNRKYIKGLVVMGGEGYCIVQAIRYWDLADQAYDRYSRQSDYYMRSWYYYDYDFYKDRRDLYLWLSGVSMFLSMIDAYVDAHLANFDIDITPPFDEPENDAVGLRLTFRF